MLLLMLWHLMFNEYWEYTDEKEYLRDIVDTLQKLKDWNIAIASLDI